MFKLIIMNSISKMTEMEPAMHIESLATNLVLLMVRFYISEEQLSLL